MAVRLHHVALRTRDLARAERFYADALGLPVRRRQPHSVWLEAGETMIMLEQAAGEEPVAIPGDMALLAFAVEPAMQATLVARLQEAGGTLDGRTDFTVYLRDPDGHRVGLSHFVFAAAAHTRQARVRSTWTPPPGPMPAGAAGDPSLEPAEGESLDALSGEWKIFQRRDGHRYSTDDLLAAWFAAERAERRGVDVRRVLDLGSGIGSIAMMTAWRFPTSTVVAVEAQAISADLFARSIRYNGAASRIELRRGDLRDPEMVPESAWFDLVAGSPPYFDEKRGVVSELPQRGPCRFELRGGVEGYVEAGARALAARGTFVLVHLLAERSRIEAAARAHGLVLRASLEVVFREGKPPLLGLFELGAPEGAGSGEELGTLVIRDLAGKRTPAFSAARLRMGFPP